MPSDNPTEQLCDQVAAEFLVPEALLRAHWTSPADIRRLAIKFKVSRVVIVHSALDLGLISRPAFFQLYDTYMAEFAAKKQGQEPGGHFYYTARKRVSPTFAAYVDSGVKTDKLLYRDAYKLTGLVAKHTKPLSPNTSPKPNGYIVDSNFFIQAHRMYYPLDVMPSFWQRVMDLADTGRIISIDKVRNEIVKNKD